MIEMLRGNAFSCVCNVKVEPVVLAPHADVHLLVFGRELEGIRQQVVHYFVDVIGHEIHFHASLREKL